MGRHSYNEARLNAHFLPAMTDRQAQISMYQYMFSLVLLLLWRPSLDFGFLLTPTYFLFFLMVPLLLFSRRIVLRSLDVALVLFYSFLLFTSIYAPKPESSIRLFLGLMVFFGLYCSVKLILNRLSPDQALLVFGKVGKIYFLSALFFYLMGFINYGGWQEHQLYYGLMVERAIPRLVAFGIDPNMSAITFLPFIFYFMLGKKSYFWLSLGLLLLFATMSRGAILSLIVGLVGLVFLRPNKTSLSAVGAFLILVLIGSVGAVVFDLLPMGYLEQRLAGLTQGSGRVDIWFNAMELFFAKPFVGWGGFSFRDVNEIYFGDARFAHNTYIEVLVESGLVGFILFLFFLFLILRRAIQVSLDSRFLFVLPALLSFFVSLLFLSLYINQLFVLYLSLLNFNLFNGRVKYG